MTKKPNWNWLDAFFLPMMALGWIGAGMNL